MVLLKLQAGLYNPEKPEKVIEVEAIVDTGAIFSVIRRDILEQLCVKPVERRRFRAFGNLSARWGWCRWEGGVLFRWSSARTGTRRL